VLNHAQREREREVSYGRRSVGMRMTGREDNGGLENGSTGS
jgi:hypothetical protein